MVLGCAWGSPLMNTPPPLNKDYSRGSNIKALNRRGFIHHGSTLEQFASLSLEAFLG